jgi:hypothetical protein
MVVMRWFYRAAGKKSRAPYKSLTMPATPGTLNHLRNTSIATFVFLLLLIATLIASAVINDYNVSGVVWNDMSEEGLRRKNALANKNQIVTIAGMLDAVALGTCILTTFGLAMQIDPPGRRFVSTPSGF